jgi:hypothetical protein
VRYLSVDVHLTLSLSLDKNYAIVLGMRLLPHHRLIETDAYDMASACLSYSSAKLLPPLLHSGPAYCTVHWSLQGNCDLRCAYTGAWGYCNSAIPDIILNYSFLEHPSQSTFGFLSHSGHCCMNVLHNRPGEPYKPSVS